MSSHENPYQPQGEAFAAAPGVSPFRPQKMDYTGAYGYVFQSPNWVANIFFMLIAQLIPVVGPIIAIGYQFEIVEALLRDPRRVYPDFDWGKFVQYLTRGIWPFLVGLIVGLVVAPFFLVAWFGMLLIAGPLASGGNDAAAAIGIMVVVGGWIVAILLMLVLQFVVLGFQIRAGLAQDFAASFNFGWVRDFLASVWLEMLLAMLFLAVTGWVLIVLGLLAFCVGAWLAMAWVLLAQAHIYFQLYRLYLARGGMPVPLKAPMPLPGAVG